MDALVERVVKTISEAVKPEKIFLFGSRSNGKAGADSDIDLLLLCSGNEDKRQTQL